MRVMREEERDAIALRDGGDANDSSRHAVSGWNSGHSCA